MKNTFILCLLAIFCFTCFSVFAASEKQYYQTNNGLKYHQSITSQIEPKEFIKIPFGQSEQDVGGSEQDKLSVSDGVPYAFRIDGKSIWILDSINGFLKCYSFDSQFQAKISIASFGKVVTDFDIADDGFWLLAPNEGHLIKIDSKGEKICLIEGIKDASRLQVNNDTICVLMPLIRSIYKFVPGKTKAFELHSSIQSSNDTSLFENNERYVYDIGGNEKTIEILTLKGLTKSSGVKFATIKYDGVDEGFNTKYVRKTVIGKDANHNVYLWITACDDYGVIYQDRIYRINPSNKEMKFIDILSKPSFPLTPNLPRKAIVAPDGKIITFLANDGVYSLIYYSF